MTQAIFIILPGKQPTLVYICAGLFPSKSLLEKYNYTFIFVLGFCLISFCYTHTRKNVLLSSVKSESKTIQNNLLAGWTLPPISGSIETLTLANFATILLCMLITLLAMLIFGHINSLTVDELTLYPYFLIVNLLLHGGLLFRKFCLAGLFLFNSKLMRKFIFRELSRGFEQFISIVTFRSRTNLISIST